MGPRSAFCLALLAAALLLPASPLRAAEARLLTAADAAGLGGSDFDGGAGDLLLRSDAVWAVIHAPGATPDFGVPFAGEALPSSGVLIDLGTVSEGDPDPNDQLSEIHHLLNVDAESPVLYGQVLGSSVDPAAGSASFTLGGVALFPGVSSPSNPTLPVVTTYELRDGEPFVRIRTTVTNAGASPVPVFQIADIDVLAGRSRLPFQPFPFRGAKPPPLDLGDPLSAVGVFPFLATVGNLGPEDGPVATGGSPADEVTYTYVAPSLSEPLVGVANGVVAAAGNFFDLAAVGSGSPPLLQPGDSLVHERKLVVTRRNDVESGLAVALPLLGLGARAEFGGRVVDASGQPVADAHVFLENTFPGADPALDPLVTTQDEDQDGVIDGVIPVDPGDPVPLTHAVTGPDGRFSVQLPALVDPSVAATVYEGRIQAPERDTLPLGPLTVDLAALAGPPSDLGDLELSGTGEIAFRVTDLASGEALPGRIRILGVLGSESPDLGSQYLSVRNFPGLAVQELGDEDGDVVRGGNSQQLSETLVGLPALNVAAEADGEGVVSVSPGRYLVVATRGLEYTVDARLVSVTEGASTPVELRLARVVDTSGLVSMDFHVHSARSFDSSAPPADRVVSYLSKGVEVLVATDHDHVTDYAPVIQQLGVGDRIASIVGNEQTGGIPVPPGPQTGGVDAFPEAIGHWNAWPLELIPGERRDGAPPDEFLNPATVIDRVRGMDSLKLVPSPSGTPPTPSTATLADWLTAFQIDAATGDEEVVMLNHPRAGFAGTVVIGLFNSLANPGGDPAIGGYDPTRPITAFPNNLLTLPSLYSKAVVGPPGTDTNGLSFDALEVMNGPGLGGYLEVRRDWFSLLRQGLAKTGTAVADSHRVVLENAGFPRSYVASSTDAPGAVDRDELTASVKAMRLFGTTGPILRVSVEDDGGTARGLGEIAVATGPRVRLRVRVDAAPWIPVEELRVLANGELVETLAVPPGKVLGKVERLDRTLPLQGIGSDAFLTVEAGLRIDEQGRPLSPALLEQMELVEPEVVPLAWTNPIFVDRDGDGYAPPGL